MIIRTLGHAESACPGLVSILHCVRQESNSSQVEVKLESHLSCLAQGQGIKVNCYGGAHQRSTKSLYIWKVWDNNSSGSWTVANIYSPWQLVGSHLSFHCSEAAVGQSKRHRTAGTGPRGLLGNGWSWTIKPAQGLLWCLLKLQQSCTRLGFALTDYLKARHRGAFHVV